MRRRDPRDDGGMELDRAPHQGLASGDIVVGLDGSPASHGALAWALAEARLRGTGVRAVLVWRRPERSPRGYIPPELLDPQRLRNRAEARLDGIVERLRAASPETPLVCEAVEGIPEEVLVRMSETAALLVVGAPAHSSVGELVRGSVARACVRRARCPVVVIPPHVSAAKRQAPDGPARPGARALPA